MKKNLFLAFALMLSLLAVSACGGGGGGSSSAGGGETGGSGGDTGGKNGPSGPSVVITSLPRNGLNWEFNDPNQPILERPVFDGVNFVALGQKPSETQKNGSFIFSPGSEKQVYESLDGISWGPSTTLQTANGGNLYWSGGSLSSFPKQVYFDAGSTYNEHGSVKNFLERHDRKNWEATQESNFLIHKVVGRNDNASGPYYDTYNRTMYLTRGDLKGQALSCASDSNFYFSNCPNYETSSPVTLTDSKVLQLFRAENSQYSKTFLLQAPLGKTRLEIVKSFPDTQAIKAGNLDYNRNLYMAYGKGLYLVGIGGLSQIASNDYTEKTYSLAFYSSKDLNSWSEVQELRSRYTQDQFISTNRYELGGISYVRGLFIIFLSERGYIAGATSKNRPYTYYVDQACNVLVSTDLVTFQKKTFTNVYCGKSQAFYANGRFILTAGIQTGTYGNHDTAVDAYRLVTITATYP